MGKRISAFTDDALGKMDAVALAEAIARGNVSVAEVTEAAIARAEKVNSELNAIVVKTYDDARNYTPAKGGMFYGVPAFVKDTDNIRGYPTQLGTGAFKAKTAKRHSKFVQQFLSTGINNLGKSTMPEFGLICSTENEKWGITRNPWNTDYTTGGSSSGSAALVASGVVPIATANDGAGSIRIPAACCGLVGLKPSRWRLVSMDGSQLMPLQIVYQGVLTRSVRDTAAFYAAAEKFYKNPRLPEMGYVKHPSQQRLRIAFFFNPEKGKLGHQDKDTYRTQLETAKLLETLGHTVEQIPVPIDIDAMSEHYLNYYGFLAYMLSHMGTVTINAKVDHGELEPFTMGLSKQFKANALQIPRSIRLLRKTGRDAEALFEKYDVIMTPVVSHNTPPIGHFSTSLTYEEISRRAIEYASYAGLQNITGAPAISLPLGTSENSMPIGVHFTAPYGLDKRLLELAYELEQAKQWRLVGDVLKGTN
ncbi:MAG: amidase [Chitinophagales bacterium]|nr:amidase [Chitinophagales bacterium]